jgi:sulfur-oxidizing protein SoxY
MSLSRRKWLSAMLTISAAGAVLVSPLRAFAAPKAAFDATDTDVALKTLVGDKPVEASDAITFKIPDIAENGAVVPVTVSTDIEGVKSISILIEENPNPLVATFVISSDSFADISTRVKMGKSSRVQALVETQDRFLVTTKEVKVTIGGCGG